MTKQEKYIKDQAECGIKVGDRVKVMRKTKSYTNGWDTCWVPEMNESVGKVFKVEGFSEFDKGDGFLLSDGFYYPFFVLEKVVTRKGGKKVAAKVVAKVRKK